MRAPTAHQLRRRHQHVHSVRTRADGSDVCERPAQPPPQQPPPPYECSIKALKTSALAGEERQQTLVNVKPPA
jgi:hypothetical protein